MSLIDALTEITKKVDKEIQKVNWGGCCVFASLAAEHLENLGLNVKIRVGDFAIRPTRRHARKALGPIAKVVPKNTANDWLRYGVDMSHVVAEFEYEGKKYFFDAEGVAEKTYELEPFCGTYLHRGSIPIHVAKELANSGGWNPTFKRTQIPKLEALLEVEFSKLKVKTLASR